MNRIWLILLHILWYWYQHLKRLHYYIGWKVKGREVVFSSRAPDDFLRSAWGGGGDEVISRWMVLFLINMAFWSVFNVVNDLAVLLTLSDLSWNEITKKGWLFIVLIVSLLPIQSQWIVSWPVQWSFPMLNRLEEWLLRYTSRTSNKRNRRKSCLYSGYCWTNAETGKSKTVTDAMDSWTK